MKLITTINRQLAMLAVLMALLVTNSYAVKIQDFNFEFLGVTNDLQKNQSTWTYRVSGTNAGKDLSHWVLALCSTHRVAASSNGYEVNTDPTLGVYGIKYDISINTNSSRTFSFTLNGIYQQAEVTAAYKAGQGLYYGKITGPSCDIYTVPKVEKLTLASVCSDVPAVSRRWRVNNPNSFNVNATWTVYGTTQSGSLAVLPGENYFVTSTAGTNTVILSWKNEANVAQTDTKASSGERCEQPKESKLGDRVWNDVNKNGLQDNGEPGVKDVQVKLYGCSDNALIASALTDADGDYLFDKLEAGDYKVLFVLPANYKFSPKDAGQNNSSDSDADVLTGYTECVSLALSETNLTVDAGIYSEEPEQKVDLSLTKTVNSPTANDGDNVTFTITVKNAGPGKASGVKVTDILPEGLDYSSSQASKGAYSEQSGLWTVGELAKDAEASLNITAKVDLSEINTSSIDLGMAKDFNVFVLEDITQPSSDTEGRVAGGRDVTFGQYSVGDKLPFSNGQVDALVAGRNLTFLSGSVDGGNAVYGKATNLPIDNVSVAGGSLIQGNPIDFEQAGTYLNGLSASLKEYEAKGITDREYCTLRLRGSDPFFNVFNLSGAELSTACDLRISVPNGSVVLVNISGREVNWTGGLKVSGTDISNVLYNFYEAEKIKIEAIDVTGSILAPKAEVEFVSGVQNGQMIARSLKGSAQFNNVPFVGNIPLETELLNVAEVTSCDQPDVDSSPANGLETEDDFAKALLTINKPVVDPGQGGENGENNWLAVSSEFAAGQIIWCIAYDKDNNMLVGTWGGKIYRTKDEGANWEVINQNMTVGYVWSLVKGTDDKLFAGTEKGVYRSDDNGLSWTLAGMDTFDVRSLAVSNGKLLAGCWGDGVYESSDNGQSWKAANSGLTGQMAVQSLTRNSSGQVFAATFGDGLFKSEDNAKTWTKLDVPYPHIWAINSVGSRLYAGTYGAGVYYSEDNGSSWSELNSGLASDYVYNVTIDKDGNVYLNSWEAGIYALAEGTKLWKPVGMEGAGVSMVAANPVNGMVYAATEKGVMYKASSAVTEVKKGEEIPAAFALMQNYPNPFNPTTTISFSIPAENHVVIRVYDILGSEVATLLNGNMKAGTHRVQFNASSLSTGIYFYKIQAGSFTQTKKALLIK